MGKFIFRKKFSFVAGMLAIMMYVGNICNAQTTKKSTVDGYLRMSTKTIPMPLGRYVQLATPSISYKYSKPDVNGNGTCTFNYQFDILRHVPNLEYFDYEIESVDDDKYFFEIKFKKDQNAVEKLSNAIASKSTSRVNIAWNKRYSDKVQLEVNEEIRQLKNLGVESSGSILYVDVPQSRISISGDYYSEYIRIAEAATITLKSEDGSSVYLTLKFKPIASQEVGVSVIATIRTEDGSYETSFFKRDVIMGTGNMMIFSGSDGEGLRYITGREMDKLLSSPIYIDLKIESNH